MQKKLFSWRIYILRRGMTDGRKYCIEYTDKLIIEYKQKLERSVEILTETQKFLKNFDLIKYQNLNLINAI